VAKGAFYPELLQMQLYMQDFSEAQSFLRDYHDDLIRPAIEAAECGLPLPSTRFRSEKYSLNQVVAVGSLIHEYVHYLQYTTRNIGLLFYESRFQQYLWTHRCLQDLVAQGHSPRLPLMKWFEEEGKNAPAPLQQWRKEWGAYQAGVSVSGLGPPIGWDDHFGNHVRSEWEPGWFPIMTFEDADGTTSSVELPTDLLLETEADIIMISLLEALFPEQCEPACQELLGPPDPVRRSIALPLMHGGLTHLVPVIADYSMQLPFDATGKLRSATARFCDMLAVVKDRYAGMSLHDVCTHNQEVVKEISVQLGVMSLEETVRRSIDKTAHNGMWRTGFGRMLLNAIRFRAENQLIFLAPVAFILRVLTAMPSAVWVCYNTGIKGRDASRIETFHGKLPAGVEQFDVIFLRSLLWACREIAIRPGRYVCPQCQISARWSQCSGQCGFVAQCEKQLGIDISQAKWQT
jgi:hypothetical protein